MDLPSEPGFYPAVTGDRSEGATSPVALYGIVTEVEARGLWYRVTGLSFRTRDAWKGTHYVVPQDVVPAAWMDALRRAMADAEAEAKRLRDATGVRRSWD